jgi:topoisomerase IV subunit A
VATKSVTSEKNDMLENTNNELSLHNYAERAYLEYAIATVKSRALAQVEDGLKPVQRRILYTMSQLGLREDAKPVKCARIVGDVLGKYHPHGDQAAYDALVRIAQDFSLRYPLIQGQGNFGSRDDDPAAAMRYTEARLSPVARLLLDELELGTVDFIDNYDGSFKEPSRLPDRLPFVLLNGSMGIAVGMAANIPSHNLREVAAAASTVVSNPKTTLDDVLVHITGPDFPDGGHIISSAEEMRAAYESGRGSVRVRGRYEREELARGQWQLVFNELPYQVSAKQVLEELDTLTNPKPPQGKKTLTPQQAMLKQLGLDLMERVNDESGKDHKVRLVIAPKNSKVSQDELLAYLFANTSLESNAPLNFTLIGLDGRPQTKGLLAVLQEWAEFRLATVRRRTEFELSQAEKRIHILEGRMTVFLNLDAVIRVIRTADEPKPELVNEFSLSEIQADDILEMRLRQLNKLEGFKLEKELDELRRLATKLKSLLASEQAMRKLIVEEIEADSKKYGDDRRTLIKAEARAKSASAVVRSVVDEPVTVVLSKNLWVRSRPGHDIDPATLAYRAGDEAWALLKTRTSASVAVLDSKGRSYSVRASDIPGGRGDGVPLTTLLDLQDGAKLLFPVVAQEEELFWFAGQSGYGLLAPFKSLLASKRAGKAFLSLEDGELPLRPVRAGEGDAAYCVSEDGRLLVFPTTEVKTLAAGGKGVKLMELGDSRLVFNGVFDGSKLHVSVDVKGKVQQSKLAGEELQKYTLHRARKGYQLPKKGAVLAVTTTAEGNE